MGVSLLKVTNWTAPLLYFSWGKCQNTKFLKQKETYLTTEQKFTLQKYCIERSTIHSRRNTKKIKVVAQNEDGCDGSKLSCRLPYNCRIHHVIASMTTIDLIINLGQAFWSRRPHFINSPLRRCEAVHCLYISVSFTFVIVSSS